MTARKDEQGDEGWPGRTVDTGISNDKKEPAYLLTKNNMGHINTLNSFAPDELTINELAERSDANRHYEGVLAESNGGPKHTCQLCHGTRPNNRFAELMRKLRTVWYCTWFDSLTWDEDDGYIRFEDEARERRGDITELEISEYRASIKKEVNF